MAIQLLPLHAHHASRRPSIHQRRPRTRQKLHLDHHLVRLPSPTLGHPKTNKTPRWNLVAAVIVTVSGRLADIFGRRWFLITGAALGCIGSIVGATGQSINTMIISGVIFGFGGGFQEMCFSCVQEMVPNRYRFTILGRYLPYPAANLKPGPSTR